MKRALIVQGGLESHEPAATAEVMAQALRKHDFEVVVSDSVDSFADPAYATTFDLLIPHVTAGQATLDQIKGLFEAVDAGAGLWESTAAGSRASATTWSSWHSSVDSSSATRAEATALTPSTLPTARIRSHRDSKTSS